MNTDVTLMPDLDPNQDQRPDQSQNSHPTIIAPDISQRIDCEACRTNIPLSAAKTSEGEDYIIYFCGLQCYEKWFRLK